ncbi:hypothetical protein SDC9_207206 [bioreactor metagenome]|uniref:Uncharacterized protein n=1 Tax=bioreactor metagenome TaxID=1076179 RepID=A0A645J6Y9_9ZZZZ
MGRHVLGWHLSRGNAGAAAFPIINPVIGTLREGIFRHGTSRVISHERHVRREEALIRLMHAGCHVCPPKKGLNEWGSIIGAHL